MTRHRGHLLFRDWGAKDTRVSLPGTPSSRPLPVTLTPPEKLTFRGSLPRSALRLFVCSGCSGLALTAPVTLGCVTLRLQQQKLGLASRAARASAGRALGWGAVSCLVT